MEDLSKRIKELRLANKLTQQQLADRLNVSKQMVSSYELGTRQPSYDVLLKIAYCFNVSTDYLFGIESKKVYLDVKDLSDAQINILKNIIEEFRNK